MSVDELFAAWEATRSDLYEHGFMAGYCRSAFLAGYEAAARDKIVLDQQEDEPVAVATEFERRSQ